VLRQYQRVHDAQNGVNGVWVRCLANPAAAHGRFPLGTKIAALQQPASRIVSDADIRIRIYGRRRIQLYIEFEFRGSIHAYETGIAVLQHLQKIAVGGIHPDGDTADGDYHVVALDLCG